MIKTLNNNYAYLLTVRTEKIKNLQIEEKGLKERFLNVKKCLKSNLALDETKLRILTSYSTNCLDYMCGLLSRGKQLVSLSDTCKKFETEREKVIKWLPLTKLVVLDGIEGGLTDDEKLYQRTVDEGFVLPKLKSATRSSASEEKSKTRPTTTSGIYRLIKSDTTETEADVDTLEFKKYAPIENVKFEAKKSEDFEEEQIEMVHSVELSSPRDKDVLDRCCENLEKMENFWILYNKVVVDVLELKEERNVLEKENKQMRGFIRAILEAAALAKSIPDSRVSTRVHSQRGAYSAPLKRIVFH